MTDATNPWPTLREFLDAGGTIESVYPRGHRGCLVEALYVSDPELSRAARAREIETETMWAEMSFDAAHAFFGGDITEQQHFESRRRSAWHAQRLAEPELADRLIAMLTPEEREQGERDRERFLKPHPLRVEMPTGDWRCYSCGTTFETETMEALIVGERLGDEEKPVLEYEIEYCRDCIAMALAAYDAGRIS